MASKNDFSEDEWKTLVLGFTGVGFYVSTSDQAFGDMFKETKEIAKHLSALQTVGETELVRELASNHKPPFGIRTSPAEIGTLTLDALRASVALLSAKAPEDLQPFVSATVATADAVAKAAKEVSGEEATALANIREALGVTSTN